MFSFLKNLVKKEPDYAAQKKALTTGDPAQLQALARDKATNPEILYFLAKSNDQAVRKAIAENAATPMQAAALLAMDSDVDVRLSLASRLTTLLPDLSPEKQSQLYAYAVEALGMLAQDEVLHIRRALSTALRDYAKAPPAVVNRLARDVEREISEPILRFCVALAEDDLFDILGGHPDPWVISAIAGRAKISERISQAIFERGDIPATTLLLGNKGAALAAETLQKIVEQARHHPEWHHPVAMRPEVSFEIARQLAGFVDATILDVLGKRSDFDAETRKDIAGIVKRRMEFQREAAPHETVEGKVARYVKAGNLTPDVISDALAWQDMDFVILALAHLSGIPPQIVTKMLNPESAKPVVALCWKAKLPMRLCVELQRQAAKIQPSHLLYARNGTDYPLTAEEIKWQLEFFGV